MSNKQIKELLSKLSVPEIIEIMHDVLIEHKFREQYEDGDFYQQSLALAQVTWGCTEGVIDKEPTIYMLGKVHPTVASAKWGDSISQDGKCTNCNSIVASQSKVAVCPICEQRVSCT